MRQRSPRRRPNLNEDPDYLAWLRLQPCRAPGLPTHWGSGHRCDPHHARHDEHGNSLGANIKDDRRACSLDRQHHRDVEQRTGPFKGWTRARAQAWENQQIAAQRGQYEAERQRSDSPADFPC
jgi:hypothetical protein